jgi:hypothetical protein
MDFLSGMILITTYSFIFTCVFKYQDFTLFIIRWLHFTSQLILILYPLIFDVKYDIYYLVFITFLFLHWIYLKGECILSYWEKKHLDPSYVMGQDVYSHPFMDDLIKNKNVMYILGLCILISASYVWYRFLKPRYPWLIIIVILNSIYQFYILTKRYF